MSLPEMMEYTFKSKYAGYSSKHKRRESWSEAVDRYCDMFLVKYEQYPEVNKYIARIRKSIKQKNVLGSQRGLQFGGDAVLRKNARIYNCTYSHVDRVEFFQQAMYLLLCGCGVGYSVQKHHVAKLPKIEEIDRKSGKKKFTVPDSIEGWADSIGVLISSYLNEWNATFPDYSHYEVKFDFSEISPLGTPLSSCRGKAPGPEPLKNALEKIRTILDAAQGRKLRPIEVHDIICHFSDAVISGGVRRSALISLFSSDDKEMMSCKTGNWFTENPQRARANNSAVLLRNSTSFEEFENLIKCTREYGEPGFYWTDDLEFGTNPCAEICFYPYFNGKSGWQGCNLSTINSARIKTRRDYFRAARDAAIIGTLQAGFTNFPYLGEISEEIFKKEALLGVSMTGIMSGEVCLDPDNQKIAAEIVKRTNAKIAKIIGINAAARTTCVKPEGTSSCILGTSSGIHPHHAKRYIRRIQSNKNEPLYNFFKSINPEACEESVWSANDSDEVISFCIEVPDGAKLKNQMSALDLLKVVRSTQQNWVTCGKNEELCVDSRLNHNVSNTITVREFEWEEVTKFIYDNKEFFCGVSLLSDSGDKDYPQAPFYTILLPHEQVSLYGDAALFASGLIEKAKELWDDNLWKACDTLLGVSKDNKGASKKDWINKAVKYSVRYLGGDIKLLTYCLKDVDTYKKYVDLKREYKKVDYSLFIEDEDNTNVQEEVACAGGACQLI